MGQLESKIMEHAGASFNAFGGSGRTLGGGRAAVVNPWAEQREQHMKQRMTAQQTPKQTTTQTTAAEGGDDDDSELKRALELSKQEAEKSTGEAGASSSSTAVQSEQDREEIMAAIEQSVNQEMLQELLSMDFPKVRALKALINTGSASVQHAVDWIFEHQDDADIDAPIDYKVETPEQREERMLRTKEKAREIQEALRAKKREEEKQREKELELKRRIQGKQTQDAQEKFREEQRKREIEEERARKMKDRDEKRRMKQLLQEDRARRKAERMVQERDIAGLQTLAQSFPDIANKHLMELGVQMDGGSSSSVQHATPSMHQEKQQPAKRSEECTIQLRLLDGKVERVDFRPHDTLRSVFSHAQSLQGGSTRFDLMSPFPRKTFSAGEMTMTLEELNLAPRAQLICTPK